MLTGVATICVFLCSIVLRGEVEAKKGGQRTIVWWAPDSSWAVGGFGKLRPGLLEQILAAKPADFDGAKLYELQANEPGEWLGFCVELEKVDRVVFTKDTKFVLTDKAGRRVESEAIVFSPDLLETQVYDARRTPVVVSQKSVWCGCIGGMPTGRVKFPLGSIKREDIVSFEVVGAVEQSSKGGTSERR